MPWTAPRLSARGSVWEKLMSKAYSSPLWVVGNVKGGSLYQEMSWTEPATVFRPLTQYSSRSLSLVVRTAKRLDGIGEMVARVNAFVLTEVCRIRLPWLSALIHQINNRLIGDSSVKGKTNLACLAGGVAEMAIFRNGLFQGAQGRGR
jgi:hypothetical protein